MDEYIFSPSGIDIYQFLEEKQARNVTSVRIVSQHFLYRQCLEHQRVTDSVLYYPIFKERVKYWGPKIIAITKYLKQFKSIHEGGTIFGT